MTAPDTPTNPPLRLRAGACYRTRGNRRVGPLEYSHDTTHWTKLDTVLTLAAFLAALTAIIAVAAGWGLAL